MIQTIINYLTANAVYILLFLLIGTIITLLYYILTRDHTNKTFKIITIILMEIAEKYISKIGKTKMQFVVNILDYIFENISTTLKTKRPSINEIRVEAQKIFDFYKNDIEKIKTIVKDEESEAKSVVEELTQIDIKKNEKAN